MSNILSKKFYHQAGEQVDRKLAHMQDVIFRLACKKAHSKKAAVCKVRSHKSSSKPK